MAVDPTIYDIVAKHAGVGIATVSRVLNVQRARAGPSHTRTVVQRADVVSTSASALTARARRWRCAGPQPGRGWRR